MENESYRAKRFIAQAKPSADGKKFVGMYGIPGLYTDLARDTSGRVAMFDTAEEAKLRAAERMIELANKPHEYAARMGNGKRDDYDPLFGPELSSMIGEADLTLLNFATITGQSEKRANQWITGVDERGGQAYAPHWVRVLLHLFINVPGAYEAAEAITKRHSHSKRERRMKAQ